MKRLLSVFLFVALVLTALCGETVTLQKFVGSYYRGDHLGYNVTLALKADGRYHAQWTGCLGVYGTARGEWKIDGEKLVLVPAHETGMMVGHLKVLLVRYADDRFTLLPEAEASTEESEEPKDWALFKKIDDGTKG